MRSMFWLLLMALVACQRAPSNPEVSSITPGARASAERSSEGAVASVSKDVYYLRAELAEQVRAEKIVTFCGESGQPDALLQNTHQQLQVLNILNELHNVALRESIGEPAPTLLPKSYQLVHAKKIERNGPKLVVSLPSGALGQYVESSAEEIRLALESNNRCLEELKLFASAVDLPNDQIVLENLAVFERGSLRLAVENARVSKANPKLGPASVGTAVVTFVSTVAGLAQADRVLKYAKGKKRLENSLARRKINETPRMAELKLARSKALRTAQVKTGVSFALAFIALAADQWDRSQSVLEADQETVLAHAEHFEELMQMTDAEFRSYLQSHPDEVRLILKTIQNFAS